MSAHYDDPNFSYVKYWQGRDYEHFSEVVALKKLLSKQSFPTSADIGGGYGRLTTFISRYSKNTYLIEPSVKQLTIAKKSLSEFPSIKIIKGTSEKTSLPASSLDLAILIRVSHHLPDLMPTISELKRVLKPGGLVIFEIANSVHFKARLKNWLAGTPVHNMPVERRSLANIRRKTIDFVNHHPRVVKKLLQDQGFEFKTQLSVSNLRSSFFKKLIPFKLLVSLESWLQSPLSSLYFGPSIFLVFTRGKAST